VEGEIPSILTDLFKRTQSKLKNRLKPFQHNTQDSTPNSPQRQDGIIDEHASKLAASYHVCDAFYKRNESLKETVDHTAQISNFEAKTLQINDAECVDNTRARKMLLGVNN
jgi:hypothetical protein